MAGITDNIIDLERHRKRLEDNVAELRKSLQYWQTWEAEYEGLREQIQGLGDEPKGQELEDEGKDFGGLLLNDKEIKELFHDGKGQRRTSLQILGLLSRRIDCKYYLKLLATEQYSYFADVQENVKAVARRLDSANKMLLTANVVSQPTVRNEEGLPITEISEELDEDGNIISSSTTRPGDSTPQLFEALRKAGVKDLPQLKKDDIVELESSSPPSQIEKGTKSTQLGSPATSDTPMVGPRVLIVRDEDPKQVATELGKIIDDAKARKKRVSFAEDTKDPAPAPASKGPLQLLEGQRKVGQGRLATYRTSTGIPASNLEVVNIDDNPDDSKFWPMILHDDSPEDADLRRQMLDYSMNEVGAIVAEMDIDDNGSYTSCSDDDENDQYPSSAEEDEDRYGRTTRPVITEKYRKQMQELEQKLNARIIDNVGPNPDMPSSDSHSDDSSPRVNLEHENTPRDMKTSKKKGVRFTEELDVSKEPSAASIKLRTETVGISSSGPISETVTERSTTSIETSDSMPRKQKPSRFKATRSGMVPAVEGNATSLPMLPAIQAIKKPFHGSPRFAEKDRIRQVPEGPQGQTHAAVLIERAPRSDVNTAIEPDELDPALLHQEVAVEYHRMRNRMIQRNGGFMQTDEESAEVPVTEGDEDESGGRKMSRFKAARLARLSK